jgi:hypothetical protein
MKRGSVSAAMNALPGFRPVPHPSRSMRALGSRNRFYMVLQTSSAVLCGANTDSPMIRGGLLCATVQSPCSKPLLPS